MTRQHYVYRITDIKNNMHYYGARTTTKEPKDDLGIYYFSSSSNKQFIKNQKNNPDNFKYKIIKIFKHRKDAIKLEIKLHNKFNVGVNESFYNKCKQTSTGFDTSGIIPYNKGRKSLTIISPNLLLRTYKQMTHETKTKLKGKVNIVTPSGKHLNVSCDNVNYLNGTYISLNKINGKENGKKSAISRQTNPHIFKNTIISGQQLANINNVKNMKQTRDNGKTGYENRTISFLETMNKEFIDCNGILTTKQKQRTEKQLKTLRSKSTKYNLYHIELGLITENIPAYELRKIHQSLVTKFGKSNYLGRTPQSKQKHINNGNSILVGLYSEIISE